MSDVTPIKPTLKPEPEPGQRLREKANRDFMKFANEVGVPVAYALVLIDAEGTIGPYYQTEHGAGGWRSFLALAGAMLVERALQS